MKRTVLLVIGVVTMLCSMRAFSTEVMTSQDLDAVRGGFQSGKLCTGTFTFNTPNCVTGDCYYEETTEEWRMLVTYPVPVCQIKTQTDKCWNNPNRCPCRRLMADSGSRIDACNQLRNGGGYFVRNDTRVDCCQN